MHKIYFSKAAVVEESCSPVHPADLQTDTIDVGGAHDPDQSSQHRANDGPVLGALRSGPLLLVAPSHSG